MTPLEKFKKFMRKLKPTAEGTMDKYEVRYD